MAPFGEKVHNVRNVPVYDSRGEGDTLSPFTNYLGK